MKICYHIAFFYKEDRFIYLSKIIQECQKYLHETDVFIHTNKNFPLFHSYTNGKIENVVHDLTKINPFKLTWCCRDLMKKQQDNYDVFIYGEDDILIYSETLYYWFQYHHGVNKNKYNLGFLRIEYECPKNVFSTDLKTSFTQEDIIELKGRKYILNNINPYCGFWIYSNKIFKQFTQLKYYHPEHIEGYGIRESSAIGLHGKQTDFFKGTLIPLNGLNQINNQCFVHHIPNNYLQNKDSRFGKIDVKLLIQ